METSKKDMDYSQLKELAQEKARWCRRKTKTCPWGRIQQQQQHVMLRVSSPSSRCLSVRPSVCPSVRYTLEPYQARITKSSLWVAIKTPVFRDKISRFWVKGFLSNEGIKEGYPLKILILSLSARKA